MKKIVVVVLLLFFLMVVAGVIGVILIVPSDPGNIQTMEIYEESTVSVGNSRKINLDLVSSDVNIKPHSGDDIKLIYRGTTNKADIPKLIANKEFNEVNIKIDNVQKKFRFQDLFTHTSTTLDVLVPSSFSGNLEIDGVSGDVLIDGLDFASVDHETVSGDLKLVNGNIGSFVSQSVSGDVYASGLNGDVDIESVSGDSTIFIPESFDYILDWDTVSGSLSEDKSQNSGGFKINVETVSGNLSIKRL